MPKELVHDTYYGRDDDAVAYGSDIVAEVSWGRDTSNVQLVTKAPDDWVLEPTPEGNGWYVTLDRYGINHLIRLLRKARDQAYGADA